jgi:hypothetical protein
MAVVTDQSDAYGALNGWDLDVLARVLLGHHVEHDDVAGHPVGQVTARYADLHRSLRQLSMQPTRVVLATNSVELPGAAAAVVSGAGLPPAARQARADGSPIHRLRYPGSSRLQPKIPGWPMLKRLLTPA